MLAIAGQTAGLNRLKCFERAHGLKHFEFIEISRATQGASAQLIIMLDQARVYRGSKYEQSGQRRALHLAFLLNQINK